MPGEKFSFPPKEILVVAGHKNTYFLNGSICSDMSSIYIYDSSIV